MRTLLNAASWLWISVQIIACGDDAQPPQPTTNTDASPPTQADAGPTTQGGTGTDTAEPSNGTDELNLVDASNTSDSKSEPSQSQDSGSTPRSPSVDAGPDSGELKPVLLDSGTIDQDGEALQTMDAALDPCSAACAAASGLDCQYQSDCASQMCLLQEDPPGCLEEANTYLTCIGQSPPEDFSCLDGYPSYIGYGCEDIFLVWLDCAMN